MVRSGSRGKSCVRSNHHGSLELIVVQMKGDGGNVGLATNRWSGRRQGGLFFDATLSDYFGSDNVPSDLDARSG